MSIAVFVDGTMRSTQAIRSLRPKYGEGKTVTQSALGTESTLINPGPITGQFAKEIKKAFAASPKGIGPQERTLIDQVLSFAAQTEQKVAEQDERIHYLESLSETDELTGLWNRRGFNRALERTLANANRYDEHGILAYIDLDDFKQINDELGHAAGDYVLQYVAAILTGNVRQTDYVARLGGDEFGVLFVRANQLPARAHAMELQALLNRASISFKQHVIDVRASVGIQAYGASTDPIDLIRKADQAMYQEKRRRRMNHSAPSVLQQTQ
jgi:diguanylate cyclase (GGDEF)-like protein